MNPSHAAAAADGSYPRLVADIGGTNARFGWIAAPVADVEQVQTLAVPDHAGPAAAARTYLSGLARTLGPAYRPPRHAAMAVATPVTGDGVSFTNSHWTFSCRQLQQELGVASLRVLNDFEALALALPHLGARQLRAHGALPRAQGTLAVVGPGTGLGVAGVVQTGSGWLALPGEGGHSTLAAGDDFEDEVLRAARRQHGHVSAERLLSGIGLPALHQAVAAALGRPASPPLTAEQVVELGREGTDAVCASCLDTFCAMLGSFAGNVALTLGARGGVFIGGGIVPRIAERFFASAFRQRFESKGRMSPYVEAIPTALITDTLAALSGAAAGIGHAVGDSVDEQATTPRRLTAAR
jgi:glucokinase